MYSVLLTKRQPVVIWARLWLLTIQHRITCYEHYLRRSPNQVRHTEPDLSGLWNEGRNYWCQSFPGDKHLHYQGRALAIKVRWVNQPRGENDPELGLLASQVRGLDHHPWLIFYLNVQPWLLSPTIRLWSEHKVWVHTLFSSVFIAISHWVWLWTFSILLISELTVLALKIILPTNL